MDKNIDNGFKNMTLNNSGPVLYTYFSTLFKLYNINVDFLDNFHRIIRCETVKPILFKEDSTDKSYNITIEIKDEQKLAKDYVDENYAKLIKLKSFLDLESFLKYSVYINHNFMKLNISDEAAKDLVNCVDLVYSNGYWKPTYLSKAEDMRRKHATFLYSIVENKTSFSKEESEKIVYHTNIIKNSEETIKIDASKIKEISDKFSHLPHLYIKIKEI